MQESSRLQTNQLKAGASTSRSCGDTWRFTWMDGRFSATTNGFANGQPLTKAANLCSQVDHYAQDKRCEDKWNLVSQCFYQGEPCILFPLSISNNRTSNCGTLNIWPIFCRCSTQSSAGGTCFFTDAASALLQLFLEWLAYYTPYFRTYMMFLDVDINVFSM
jgi:hypothetical protein